MSLNKNTFLLISFCVIQSAIVCAQFNTTRRLCYNFSWLGPRYDNETVLSQITCENITSSANNIPCRHPLVVTHDGTLPDMDYLWENYLEDSTCLLTDDAVCAQYIYRFDGFIQNITYMCTRVLDENQQAVTAASCMSSFDGSRQVDLCICSSEPGQMPCNGANSLTVPMIAITLFILLTKHCFIDKIITL